MLLESKKENEKEYYVRIKYTSKRIAHGCMASLEFYLIFNSISVVAEQWESDNESLCSIKSRLRLEGFLLLAGLKGSARLAGQRLLYTHAGGNAQTQWQLKISST